MAAANFPIILVSLCKYFLYPFIIPYWKCPVEKAGIGISEILDIKIFWESSLKTFLLCVCVLRPWTWKYTCWTRNCDLFIYNLFVYVKKGSIAQKWGVIENVNKLHQATVKLRLVKILEILGPGASYHS